jgi:hypothetical protein
MREIPLPLWERSNGSSGEGRLLSLAQLREFDPTY